MSAAQLTGYCPLCESDPAEILNLGREHWAVCHDCKTKWHVGSNLFSAWRDEEPEAWERNKELLASYTNAADAESKRCNGPNNLEYPRPPLGSLGDCLAETAAYRPHGYTRFTGCDEPFWLGLPVDKDGIWFAAEADTACLRPAPVTIFVAAGTSAATAREVLKQVAKWLKTHGDELENLTPIKPGQAACDNDSIPF